MRHLLEKAGISNLILKLAEILLGHCLNVLQWDLFFLNVPLYKIKNYSIFTKYN